MRAHWFLRQVRVLQHHGFGLAEPLPSAGSGLDPQLHAGRRGHRQLLGRQGSGRLLEVGDSEGTSEHYNQIVFSKNIYEFVMYSIIIFLLILLLLLLLLIIIIIIMANNKVVLISLFEIVVCVIPATTRHHCC